MNLSILKKLSRRDQKSIKAGTYSSYSECIANCYGYAEPGYPGPGQCKYMSGDWNCMDS